MLSGDADTAAKRSNDALHSSAWLPEFDSPGISIALPSLSGADDDSQSCAKPAGSVVSADAAGAQLTANLDNIADPVIPKKAAAYVIKQITSDDISNGSSQEANVVDSADGGCKEALISYSELLVSSPVATTEQEQLKLSTDLFNSIKDANDGSKQISFNNTGSLSAATNMLDHLGLNFDFNIGSDIDAMSSAPLFSMPISPTFPATDPQAVDKNAGSSADKFSDSSSNVRKIRGRRASIASILLRRSSKTIEHSTNDTPLAGVTAAAINNSAAATQLSVNPTASLSSAAASAQTSPVVDNTKGVCHNGNAAVAPEAPDVSEETARSPKGSEKAPVTGPTAQAQEASPGIESSAAMLSDAAIANVSTSSIGSEPLYDDNSICNDANDQSSAKNTDKDVCSSNSAQSKESQAALEQQSAEGQSVQDVQNIEDHASKCEDDGPMVIPLAREDLTSRNLDRRSSRILEGITRRVQHVRQTTSMVLRRSVGSRLSIIPRKSQDNFATELQPSSEVSQHETAADDEVEVADTADSVSNHKGNNDGSSSSEDPTDTEADGLGNQVTGVAATQTETENTNVAEAEPTEDMKAPIDSRPRNSSRSILSRKLITVRRGTNEVVRSSVARVKTLFAPKRPVAA
ncbi:hypothetical protein BX070DRAFT_237529 [Coemansia spiralis]|nr:hypothetical protein BX070DRAFT_237529 [Coemansia spiralis]